MAVKIIVWHQVVKSIWHHVRTSSKCRK